MYKMEVTTRLSRCTTVFTTGELLCLNYLFPFEFMIIFSDFTFQNCCMRVCSNFDNDPYDSSLMNNVQ